MIQSRFKGISLGLLIGLLGAVVSLTRWGSALEERFGLQLLFMLRGARLAPSSVAIVGMDEQSADFLDLPKDTRKWPRALHAQLIDRLNKAGAAMIVLILHFGILCLRTLCWLARCAMQEMSSWWKSWRRKSFLLTIKIESRVR